MYWRRAEEYGPGAPPPGSKALPPLSVRDVKEARRKMKSFQLLLADPLDGPAGRHKAMPPARSRCG